jgi:hypothetical protein
LGAVRTVLQHGRVLTVQPAGDGELVEIRSVSGALELRIQLTEDGPVLQLEGARISLKAAESVDVECKTFHVSADADVRIEAKGDVYVQGELVHLN